MTANVSNDRRPDPPRISVVTATHNRAARLEALLEGLRAQTLAPERFEVIVVDDGSSDATAHVLERQCARGGLTLHSLRHSRARGPAAARNRGWRQARASVIAFTDDDCVPAADWLDAILSSVGDADDLIVRGQTLPNPAETEALGPYAKTMRITHPSPHFETCNVAYPRAILERLDGFDESFPSAAGEDTDLGARAIAVGGRAAFAPQAVVHHAVFRRSAREALRDARLATDDVLAYKLNPELRAILPCGVFYGRSHPLLAVAALALPLARRRPALAFMLLLPYAKLLRYRRRAGSARLRQLPFFIVFDVVQTAATLRGAVRHRILIF